MDIYCKLFNRSFKWYSHALIKNFIFGIGALIYEYMIGTYRAKHYERICGRQPLKNLKGMVSLSRTYLFKSFKGCLPQIFDWSVLEYFLPYIHWVQPRYAWSFSNSTAFQVYKMLNNVESVDMLHCLLFNPKWLRLSSSLVSDVKLSLIFSHVEDMLNSCSKSC